MSCSQKWPYEKKRLDLNLQIPQLALSLKISGPFQLCLNEKTLFQLIVVFGQVDHSGHLTQQKIFFEQKEENSLCSKKMKFLISVFDKIFDKKVEKVL